MHISFSFAAKIKEIILSFDVFCSKNHELTSSHLSSSFFWEKGLPLYEKRFAGKSFDKMICRVSSFDRQNMQWFQNWMKIFIDPRIIAQFSPIGSIFMLFSISLWRMSDDTLILITVRKRSCGKVMLLLLSVILFTGVCLGRHLPRQTPPRQTSPLGRHPP